MIKTYVLYLSSIILSIVVEFGFDLIAKVKKESTFFKYSQKMNQLKREGYIFSRKRPCL